MHDLITRVTVFRPKLEYDVSSTPEEKFTFANETELVEDAIHNVLEYEVSTFQENATVGSIMQRREKVNEEASGLCRVPQWEVASPRPSMEFS